MHFKILGISFLLILLPTLSFAKPTQFYKPYKSTAEVQNIQPKQYILKDVRVSLSSKIDSAGFLTEEQVKQRYVEKLTEYLKLNNLLATDQSVHPISVDFVIDEKRIFAGEGLKFLSAKVVGNYAHSTMQYKSTLSLDSQELAIFSSGEKISVGKKGNLAKIARDLSGSGKPENELEDIDGFANFMINQLPK